MKALLPFCSFLLCFFSACTESQTITFKTAPIPLMASGPLFEGTNTAQGDFSPNIADYLKQQGLALSSLENATLQKVSLTLTDSLNSDLVGEITLQLAADQVDMQKVAVLNPVPAGQTLLTLNVAQEQKKIADLLRQNKMLLVADVNLKKDMESDWQATAVLEFLLTVKK